ncbi:MAG: hypothetical protein WD003_02260 [Candidatus Paceibacterota bacterium]
MKERVVRTGIAAVILIPTAGIFMAWLGNTLQDGPLLFVSYATVVGVLLVALAAFFSKV